jgi:hypothetical protein
MKIICLLLINKGKSDLYNNSYIAFIEPAYAGHHIVEATLLLSTIEIEAFGVPTFDTYNEANNYADNRCFGPGCHG